SWGSAPASAPRARRSPSASEKPRSASARARVLAERAETRDPGRLRRGALRGVVVLDRLAEAPEVVERDAAEVVGVDEAGLLREDARQIVDGARPVLRRDLDPELRPEEADRVGVGRDLERLVEVGARLVG